MDPFEFGTDGWRGVIADDFTYHSVAVVCEAIGEYLREEGTAARGAAVGYDNRFASADFAELAALMLTRQGIPVRLAATSVPTPLVSYAIQLHGLGGGVAITASHNPARYSGVKFKPWYAGSAPPEATAMLEQRANALLTTLDVDAIRARGIDQALLTREDFIPPYIARATQFVDAEVIRAAAPRLIIDPLYGPAWGVMDRALAEVGCDVRVIHGEYNPGFGGLHPEPIAEHLRPLMAEVARERVDGAIASDGDGDRLGAVTEDGAYVTPHQLLSLLVIHLVEDRGMRGGVAKTVSTTTMLDKLAARYDLPVYETPIGFKHICQLMLEKDILIGGEESGGVGFKGHIPERDATLGALYLTEMMAMRRTTLGGVLEALRERVGDYAYDRMDVALQRPVVREQYDAMRARAPSQIAGMRVSDVSGRDGLKLWLEDGSWLLLRASGTEPILRVYAESSDAGRVRALLDAGRALLAAGGVETAD